MNEYVLKIIKKVLFIVVIIIAVIVLWYKIKGDRVTLDGFSFMKVCNYLNKKVDI